MANKRIALICGHGGGDPGAVGNGYQEADIARKIGDTLYEKLKGAAETYLYDKAKNFYTAKEWSKFTTNDEVIEIHLNAYSSASAKGAEVLIKEGYTADKLDQAIMDVLAKYFTNRGIKKRSDLGNMNGFASRNISYRLIEICFITNADDMKILLNQFEKIMADIAAAILKSAGAGRMVNNPPSENVNDTVSYTAITGQAKVTAEQMKAYIKSICTSVPGSVLDMIPLYLSEGKAEGIRGDIAFAQSCLETGNFMFEGSAVTLEQNNFCGLGVTSNGIKGNSFPSPQLGIRAQIQHLKAYANKEALVNACIDPRFSYVARGCAKYVEWLGIQENPDKKGWAAGAGYGTKILIILKKMQSMAVETTPVPAENKTKPAVPEPAITGDKVIRGIQEWLNTNYRTGLEADGVYGSRTKTALIKGYQSELNVQFKAGLTVDGSFGSRTKSASVTVKRGANGNITRILQSTLYCLGYKIEIDGNYGVDTELHVKKYQAAKNLISDGIAGPNTFARLFS